MGKSKKIGTEAETAVVKVLRERGWPAAERKALTGAVDLGDITGTPGITWQVKGGHMAEDASDTMIDQWLKEAQEQKSAAGTDLGLLVWKRKMVGAANAHRWWAAIRASDLAELLSIAAMGLRGVRLVSRKPLEELIDAVMGYEVPDVACRMPLEDLIYLLHLGGYGDG